MIIPSYQKGFNVDWTKTIPENENDIAMYLNESVCLVFSDIWSEVTQSRFCIGYYMEESDDIDCKSFKKRFREFVRFKPFRIKRTFEKKRASIFFDGEEVEILAATFTTGMFSAIVSIKVDGHEIDLKDLDKKTFEIVKPYLENYGAVHPMGIEEYKRFLNVRKARITNLSKTKDGENMKRMIFAGVKLTLSTGLAAAGLAVATLVAPKLIKNALKDFYAPIAEVEVIEESEDDEDELVEI